MKTIYIVVTESNLPGEHLWNIENGFTTKKDAKNAIGCLSHDILLQIDKREFHPEFEEYTTIYDEDSGYWKIKDKNSIFYVEAWIEELTISTETTLAVKTKLFLQSITCILSVLAFFKLVNLEKVPDEYFLAWLLITVLLCCGGIVCIASIVETILNVNKK